ncbi:complex I NDUFA9 subunit family protein [Haladaptatus sp. F3-133]|uniref:Complex I NDUFA9 subunit family protein n=1 Tax=Halorutilus salinus TaxID=2487751 RepID=A0A9Q4GI20_9EURY|nr:complex I NDUFA9 subunit family protein [Halorutilus salinus]MCX2817881.1 complex I NDUFA9 subunit family protein [Halorutilus salinus]
MEVHVTGGTGFVGSHLCNKLAENGHDVVAVSRNPDESPVGIDGSVERRERDVTEAGTLDFSGADVVVHLVSLSPLVKPRGTTHHDVTAEGTRNVVEACENDGVDRLVHMSALGADTDGETAYIRAKGEAEDAVSVSSLDATVFRPSVVFGDGGEFVSFTKLLTTPYVTGLPGGGDTRFQPIYVGDLVEAVAETVENDEHTGETYEIGGPERLTLAEMSRSVYEAEGRSLVVVPVPMPLARVGLALADPLPFVPMGSDQYASLKFDNVVEGTNGIGVFVPVDELTTFDGWLGFEDGQ